MEESERDLKYLWDMLQAVQGIGRRLAGVSLEQYCASEDLQLIVERLLITLGEAAGCVSQGFRQTHPLIAWREIIDQRNLLAHGYDIVENSIVYWTCIEDLLKLKDSLVTAVPDTPAGSDDQPASE